MRSALIVDNFAPEAKPLRAVFDERFRKPRSTRGDRFVWDWWHVPGQYTHLRTPAWTYFPRALYQAFHRGLVAWGREVLGCHDISPPWLSCYVDGCRQELHGDLPHGPWAFVMSLTRWRGRRFSGGETVLVRDEVLDFWHDFASVRAVPRCSKTSFFARRSFTSTTSAFRSVSSMPAVPVRTVTSSARAQFPN